MTTRLVLDEILDPGAARVVVTRDATGRVSEAAFDLAGLPRVDGLLTGRPAVEVPALVERLCGICPAAHHLAGMRALEALAGVTAVPPTAEAVRRLLHAGAVIAIHVVHLVATDPDAALVLRRLAKAAMATAGSPGHFPATAMPGGVVAPAMPDRRDACAALVPEALAVARRVAERALSAPPGSLDGFGGADVALVDDVGRLDLFGSRLRAVADDGTVLIDGAPASDWDSLVAEAEPGSSAPRPYLVALGSRGTYRVGPVAQLRVADVPTPEAAGLQTAWRTGGGGASAARAVIVVHAVETIAGLLGAPALVAGDVSVPLPPSGPGVGVGWVDGARGLLVHRYEVDAAGVIARATILTPTAQNEPWLGEMLRAAAQDRGTDRARLEDAIREADPCLPCSSAPAGAMGLVVDTVEGP
ncbi:MAG: nickel-dependent hydrogenase large subunit [Actinomycetia bacterium]|nr:nickel-dependent hydrogenase large subunit [Actinomycetes bacterium]